MFLFKLYVSYIVIQSHNISNPNAPIHQS